MLKIHSSSRGKHEILGQITNTRDQKLLVHVIPSNTRVWLELPLAPSIEIGAGIGHRIPMEIPGYRGSFFGC